MSATWNGYEQAEQKHIWQRGDTLAEILFKQGLGKEKGPLQLYGGKGWIRANSIRNKVKNWSDVSAGTVVYIVLPKVLVKKPVAAATVATKPATVAVAKPVAVVAPKPVAVVAPRPEPAAPASKLVGPPIKPVAPATKAVIKESPSQIVDAGPEDEVDQEPSLAETDDADEVELIEVPKTKPAKARPMAIPVSLAALAVVFGAVLLYRSRGQTQQAHFTKLNLLLNISTEAYARTCGTMTLSESSTIDPAEDHQRRVKIALLEAMMVYEGRELLRLGILYQELGYFHADTTLLQALQAIGPMRRQSDEQFPPHAPSPQAFTDFLVRLSEQHARIEARIKPYFDTFPVEPKIPPLPKTIEQVNPLPPAYPDALLKLQELGGNDFVKELIDSFVGTTPGRLSTLHAAGQAADATAIAFEAHALRSSCGSLGAISMSALLQKIELAANAGDLSEVAADIERLRGEFADVVAVFRYFINDATPKAA